MTQSGWQRFSHPGFALEFSYPEVSPLGSTIARADEDRGDVARVHLMTPDRQELYFELARLSGVTPEDEYLHHRPHLEERFGAGSVSDLTATDLPIGAAWAYDFRWDEAGGAMERSALLLRVGDDTYRVIYDPRSELNERLLATLAVAG